MNNYRFHPFVRELMSLHLDTKNFAISGSGPIFARGWIDDPGDIDVIARGSAWDTASRLGVVTAAYPEVQSVLLFGGDVEFFDGWFPSRWSTSSLIDEADIIDGWRFVRLDIVAATKRILARPRDIAHLRIISEHGGNQIVSS